MNQTKVFWTVFTVSLLVLIILFFLPLYTTRNNPAVDGAVTVGFPLSISAWGYYPPEHGDNSFLGNFSYANLLIDILFIIGVSFGLSFFARYISLPTSRKSISNSKNVDSTE